jgi:hypothetical protein
VYVKWKKRTMTRTDRYRGRFSIGAHALSAVLVECRRVYGKPHQRFLAHLGTIEVWDDAGIADIAIGTGGRAKWPAVVMFWRRVSRKLDTLGLLCDRLAVEKMIAAKVPRLDSRADQ